MRTTSVELGDAAQALHRLLLDGHAVLHDHPAELVIAAQARDQILANLTSMHRHLFAGLDESVEMGPADLLRHPDLDLAEAIRRREPTRLHGPSPSDLAITPPTTAAATARDLLRTALEPPLPRPAHPALPPTRWTGRLPGRKR